MPIARRSHTGSRRYNLQAACGLCWQAGAPLNNLDSHRLPVSSAAAAKQAVLAIHYTASLLPSTQATTGTATAPCQLPSPSLPPHEVRVALDGGAPLEQAWLLVGKDGDALLVALPQRQLARSVGEEDVGVALASLGTQGRGAQVTVRWAKAKREQQMLSYTASEPAENCSAPNYLLPS